MANCSEMEKVENYTYEACKSTCHECTSIDKVENHKEDIVVEKEEFIIKKDKENKEILRKIMTKNLSTVLK